MKLHKYVSLRQKSHTTTPMRNFYPTNSKKKKLHINLESSRLTIALPPSIAPDSEIRKFRRLSGGEFQGRRQVARDSPVELGGGGIMSTEGQRTVIRRRGR